MKIFAMTAVAPARKLVAAAIAAALVLTTASCTGDDTPQTASSSAAVPSPSFDEVYREVPLNGTDEAPITWDLSGKPETEQIAAAQRMLAFDVWTHTQSDPSQHAALARYFMTDTLYQDVYRSIDAATKLSRLIGPTWVKVLNTQVIAEDKASVLFCIDRTWQHEAEKTPGKNPEKYAIVLGYIITKQPTGGGESHWLQDKIDVDSSYKPACTTWANHKP